MTYDLRTAIQKRAAEVAKPGGAKRALTPPDEVERGSGSHFYHDKLGGVMPIDVPKGPWNYGPRDDSEWKHASVDRIPIAELKATQHHLEPGVLDKYLKRSSRTPIHVADEGGEYHLIDGHHRAMAEWLKGNDTIDAKVWEG